ncbi:cyclic lactone autoinducer peptide [Paenibacillus sp. CF095]|nr:cyclic lactone autoinducer peptide [Paenibacillus sp. CF095]SDD51775.1 cyclic lactone autoinducer peptide [Paenibacillus sp. CF095]
MKIALIKSFPWKVISLFAIAFVVLRTNTMCWWIAHEPEMPEEVRKMQSF